MDKVNFEERLAELGHKEDSEKIPQEIRDQIVKFRELQDYLEDNDEVDETERTETMAMLMEMDAAIDEELEEYFSPEDEDDEEELRIKNNPASKTKKTVGALAIDELKQQKKDKEERERLAEEKRAQEEKEQAEFEEAERKRLKNKPKTMEQEVMSALDDKGIIHYRKLQEITGEKINGGKYNCGSLSFTLIPMSNNYQLIKK